MDYTCDVSEGKCNHGNKQIDWFKKEVAIKVANVMCDATHECPSESTCCKLASGEWGCCPIEHVSTFVLPHVQITKCKTDDNLNVAWIIEFA